MAHVQHKMSALVVADPAQAKKIILDAFVKARAHRINAAASLGVHWHTLTRWADRLGIRAAMDAIEQRALKEGWHHGVNRVGPPRKKAIE